MVKKRWLEIRVYKDRPCPICTKSDAYFRVRRGPWRCAYCGCSVLMGQRGPFWWTLRFPGEDIQIFADALVAAVGKVIRDTTSAQEREASLAAKEIARAFNEALAVVHAHRI